MTEVSRNARQASRFLDEIVSKLDNIEDGVPLASHSHNAASGKLFLQTQAITGDIPLSLPTSKVDNQILGVVLFLSRHHPKRQVILVSKDINMRIKARALGLPAEDYRNDRVLEDVDLLYTGHYQLDAEFWDKHARDMDSWKEQGRTFYRLSGPDVENWSANEFIHSADEPPFEAIVRRVDDDNSAIIETVRDYRSPGHAVWGISARNREQNFALNLLMDPEIDFVSLLGIAGTGKTLLTLAAGLQQTLEQKLYNEIIMTRVTVPVGEDIGFLPGTEEEKMTPWMGALMDNLEVLTSSEGGDWGRQATNDLLSKRIKIRSVNFMRGRTFLNRYIIIDEAQNLTSKQLKTLITRAGPGTKVVCLGNIAQIDTPYLTETTSGLTYVVDRFKGWEHSGHITLLRGERSRLADYSSEVL
jgi:PhoH-like ATPase